MEHTPNESKLHIHHADTTTIWSYWPIATIYVLAALLALYTVKFHVYPDYMSYWMGFVLIGFGLIKLSDVVGFAMYDSFAK